MPSLHIRYERLKEYAVGITSRERGRVTVIIDGERPIPTVIDTLAHEVGHLRQDLVNPDQHESALYDPFLLALLEGQAQQFQRAFWLNIEEFTGEKLLEYPDVEVFREWIAQRAFNWFRDRPARRARSGLPAPVDAGHYRPRSRASGGGIGGEREPERSRLDGPVQLPRGPFAK